MTTVEEARDRVLHALDSIQHALASLEIADLLLREERLDYGLDSVKKRLEAARTEGLSALRAMILAGWS